ncbi:MAG: hypothetical protein ACYTEZ_11730 [Planctomycetota bacterium]|jgi:hypothetical protein
MDVSLIDLWLPILVAAVIVFFASWLAWMVLPHHKGDWAKMPDEDGFFDSLRAHDIAPGQYIFPCVQASEMKDPEKKARWEAGPHGVLLLWPSTPQMGRNLALSFGFYIVVGIFVGYLASVTFDAGAPYLKVFQVTGTAAILGYVFGGIPNDIWFGKKPRSILTCAIDNVVYGLLTAGCFAGFWPAAL